MKVRTDFITNSSSSSFVIGFKGELTKEKLISLFKVPKDSPLYFLNEELANTLINCSNLKTKEEMIDNYCCDEFDELPKNIKKVFNKELNLYYGYVSNDNGAIEELLCDIDLSYEDDNFYIYKDGGY